MMTNNEIYRLYKRGDYDEPKLLQVLADVAGVSTDELNKIIKTEDDKFKMEFEFSKRGARWTEEQHAIYDRMTAESAGPAETAKAMGIEVKAVNARRYRDRNSRKPATVTETPKAVTENIVNHIPADQFPVEYDSSCDELGTLCGSPAPDANDIPDIDTGEDPTAISKAIADLCEVPDPVYDPEEEYPERPPELKTVSPEPPKPRTMFTELHSVLYSLEATIKRNGWTATRLNVDVNSGKIYARAWDETGNEAYICKKFQPAADQATD